MPAYIEARSKDPFTTAFGVGLPVRTYDRNARQRIQLRQELTMKQPFTVGFTGHIKSVNQVIGQTYGNKVRDEINDVAQDVGMTSSHALEYQDPDSVVKQGCEKAAHARNTSLRQQQPDSETFFVSTSHLAYRAPHLSNYSTPAWTEQSTSSMGQPDIYGHSKKKAMHARQMPTQYAEALSSTESNLRPITTGGTDRYKPQLVVPPSTRIGAAGMPTQPHVWLQSVK